MWFAALAATALATFAFRGSLLRAPGGGAAGVTLFAAVHDDVLLPIARIDGGHWLNTWPKEEDVQVPPPALADVPASWLGGAVPRSWFLWSRSGEFMTAALVSSTTRESACFAPPVLRLSEKIPARSRLAISGDVHPEPLTDVDRLSDDGRRLTTFIDDLARQHVSGWIADYHFGPHEQPQEFEARLRSLPLVITTAVRLDAKGESPIWFFEAERMKDASLIKASGVRLSGWVRTSGAALTAVGFEGRVIGGDSQRRTDVLGVVSTATGRVWFVHRIGYEGSEYVAVRLTSAGVERVVAQTGGGC